MRSDLLLQLLVPKSPTRRALRLPGSRPGAAESSLRLQGQRGSQQTAPARRESPETRLPANVRLHSGVNWIGGLCV